MHLPSDQKLDLTNLSASSRRMVELRDVVLKEWKIRVRASVEEAKELNDPILINTFPSLYDNIAEAISPDYPRTNAIASSTLATEHGGERARLTRYSPQAVVSEYQLLRYTILDVLKQENVELGKEAHRSIDESFDSAIREAVNSFALVQSRLRERFVAALTHDLRNPLATAHLYAEMILQISESSKVHEYASKIIDNHNRLDRMIQDLLDTVVFQAGERLNLHLKECNIREIVEEVVEEFAPVHGPRFHIIGGAVIGWWGREALKRAIENLVGNAVKYGARGEPIRIKIDVAYGRLLLSVQNVGDPIPPGEIESIFQVYRRAEAAKAGDTKGWGIGLPYVRSVAESHGGSVAVDSSVELGTTLLIDIPIDSRPYQSAPVLA